MGLDMHLYGEKHLLPSPAATEDGFPVTHIVIRLGYWQKFYPLHEYLTQFANETSPRIYLDETNLKKIIKMLRGGGFKKPSKKRKGKNPILKNDEKEALAQGLLAQMSAHLPELDPGDLSQFKAQYVQLLGLDLPAEPEDSEEAEETLAAFENALTWLTAFETNAESDELSRRIFYEAE